MVMSENHFESLCNQTKDVFRVLLREGAERLTGMVHSCSPPAEDLTLLVSYNAVLGAKF